MLFNADYNEQVFSPKH